MLDWLWKALRSRAGRGRTFVMPLPMRGKYDAAQTTPENVRHWRNADNLSANAAASPDVRRILRNRARYEVGNNSFAKGIIGTLANDTIGRGPRLQMLLDNQEANRVIEREFSRWARTVGLAEKLRTMRAARAEAGEVFVLLTNNPELPVPVKLDLRLIEADQVTTPSLGMVVPRSVDGIVFDAYGNPKEYHILRQHPGDLSAVVPECDRTPASLVIHYFRADRPGQSRGIPEITSSLPLFAYLRRYVLAVILGAETAANFAAVLKTTAPANGESAEVEPNAVIEVERNSITAVPEGWDISQIRAEQPTTTFAEFFDKMVNWIARAFSMPFNIAACDSSKYNYASGRLDHATYDLSVRVERSVIEDVVLDSILVAWLQEASRIAGYIPAGEAIAAIMPPVTAAPDEQTATSRRVDVEHEWFWDGREHVDPSKEANAQETRLRTGTTTLSREGAKQGIDWEVQERQRVKELRLRMELLQSELDLSPEQARGVVLALPIVPTPTTETEDQETKNDAA